MHGFAPASLLHSLRWQDVADVLLLTVLFSSAYRWLRHTLAVQVALGLLTLLAGSWFANQFGLILTSYLLSAVSAVATIILVVVFQQEIRHGLSRVNPLRWLGRLHEKTAPFDARQTLARAAFTLAQRRKGALIVIPRDDSLDECVTAGVLVDGRLSAALIDTIFSSIAPMHDGAVVVSDQRLVRASVVLPLATESDDTSHGTRHRAARGLAETTDALVICVSEEHGTVSLAHGENLDPMTNEAELRAALRRLWSDNQPSPRKRTAFDRLRLRALLPHVGIFVCVLVAWAVIALDRSQVVAKLVPLEIRGVADGLTFDPLRYTSVALELRGSRRELELLPANAVQAYVDLARTSTGLRTFRVQADVPAGIEVTNCSPATVDLRIRPRPTADADAASPSRPAASPPIDPSRRPTAPPRR